MYIMPGARLIEEYIQYIPRHTPLALRPYRRESLEFLRSGFKYGLMEKHLASPAREHVINVVMIKNSECLSSQQSPRRMKAIGLMGMTPL